MSLAKLVTLTACATFAIPFLGCSVDNRSVTVRDGAASDALSAENGTTFCPTEVQALLTCEGVPPQARAALLQVIDPCQGVPLLVGSGQLVFDPNAASACLSELKSPSCGVWGPDCPKTYVGTIPPGGACYPLFLGLDACAPGSQCITDTTCPGTCVPHAQLGQACDTMTGRGSDARDPSLQCFNSVCVASASSPELGPGDPCTSIDGGSGGDQPVCPVGYACTSGSCQAITSGPCFGSWDCSLDCAQVNPSGAQGSGGVTDGGPGAGAPIPGGICQPWKMLGEACTPGQWECTSGAYCGTDSTCILLPSVGQSCAGNAGEGTSCLNGFCEQTGFTCVAFLQAGESCSGPSGILGPGDPCGGFVLICDSTTHVCTPGCIAGNSCGQADQPCCAGQLCGDGAVCVQERCQ